MRGTSRTVWATCAALVIGFIGATACGAPEKSAAEPKVNLGSMITELMKMQFDNGQQQLVIWMPFEFFIACGTAQGDSWEDSAKAMAALKEYHVLCVMREVTNTDGTSTYANAEQIQASVVIRGPDGEEVKPLEKVPPKVSQMAMVMRQSMAAQGGAQAENMRLLFFPRQVGGKEFGTANEKGKFVIELKPLEKFEASTVTYHTPFDALHPQHACAKCKESVSAKWNFCPYCGEKQEGQK